MCLSARCVNLAAHILARVDPSPDPCDDFYQFACGKFVENAIVTDDMPTENIVISINRKIRFQIQDSLAAGPALSDLNGFKSAKTFYKSCMDEESIEKLGVQPLIDLTKSLGGWPVIENNRWNESSWNWYDVHAEMFVRGLNLSPLFVLEILPNRDSTVAKRIRVTNFSIEYIHIENCMLLC